MVPKAQSIEPKENKGKKYPILDIFTDRETAIILCTVANAALMPEANFEHVAKQMDMKNPRSIANAWGEIKKKIRDYQTKLPEDLRMPTPAPVDAEGPAAPAGRARSAICRLHGSGRVQKPEGASGAGDKRGRPHKAVAVSATAAAQKLVTPMPSAEDEEAGGEGKE